MRSASVAPIVLLERDRDRVVADRAAVAQQAQRRAADRAAAGARAAGLVADAFSADGSENVPLTRWPGRVALGSATLSSASPAVEITLAVVDAV